MPSSLRSCLVCVHSMGSMAWGLYSCRCLAHRKYRTKLYGIAQTHTPDLLNLPLLKFPLTKTISTAAYAAVPANILSLEAPVQILKPIAKSTTKAMTKARRASWSVTKYNKSIEPINSIAATPVLQQRTKKTRDRSSIERALSWCSMICLPNE